MSDTNRKPRAASVTLPHLSDYVSRFDNAAAHTCGLYDPLSSARLFVHKTIRSSTIHVYMRYGYVRD